ncbi:FHA domain-containing protein [Nocardia cyriacigeorgica]|uniref:Transcriptional regulator n=2 Tax=Nocardia cyriacigeorgica TaxID=135487 RepID=H6R689_NOCCG|nr:BTAD domain-containing putative transcriptional regulator [Nocardia cyriacigeorgica]MBF6082439.1 FHA domain-containing protein [Nocardia cyriacigeorgica]MBF6284980.1 FHA domain-containing protein [Nocardia cyriacigeorgica]MBF6426564.1 FHA domain-containing protein [Nocardia cyriacigeorgica]NEW35352.1 FHA domain-containing protein [Nocardia cyriacigeorgica]CCF65979.1 transcriptional regulator [Nocardia cyriacigeorgica GUH-2]
MSLEVRLLGPVRLLVGGEPVAVGGPKPRALLAALAVNRRRAVSSVALADMVWNEDPPDSYAASLQVFVSNIRKALRNSGIDPAAVLRTESSGYRLEIAEEACDLGRFEAARDAAARAAEVGDHATAAHLFGTALREWDGRALADLAGLQFADGFATAMDEERLLAASARIDAEIACGRASSVVGELVAMTTEHPLREPLWGQLITALYLSGRQADALDACRRVRTVLADELGIDPGPALIELEQRVLRQEPLNTVEFKRAERMAAAMTETVTEVPSAVRSGQILMPDGRAVVVAQAGLRIGRMTDNDLVIDDPKASRYHAQILPSRAGLLIKDLHSANGVFVNELPIETGALLADGDAIRIGGTVLVFQAAR